MIAPLFNFTVGAAELADFHRGKLIRYGSILKNVDTGQIAAHLQQTGLTDAASFGANFFNPVAAVSGVTSIYQNEQIKSKLAAIEASLGQMQGLQIAGLATGVMGIGITVASTVIILNRLKNIDSALEQITARLDALPRYWAELRLRDMLADLQTALERLAERAHWKDASPVLRTIEDRLDHGFNRFTEAVRRTFAQPKIDPALLTQLLLGLSLCAGAQIKTLLWLDEKDTAKLRAQKHYLKVEELTWGMPPDLLQRHLQPPDASRTVTRTASALRLSLATQPVLISALIAQDIHGQAYLEQAEAELDEPLLFLPIK